MKCGGGISPEKRADAVYCSDRCREAAEKARYCAKNPEYVERQRKLSTELRADGRYNTGPTPRSQWKHKYSREALEAGYRSGLELKVADQLEKAGVAAQYEAFTVPYTRPAKAAKYTPDYILPNGIIIETKGRFVTADRQKHLHIKACHPLLDIRFVFSNPNSRIGKKSATTYGMWCDKAGFKFAKLLVPLEWITEPAEIKRLTELMRVTGWKP